MTNEEKQLLLKDLCARVIYKPKVYVEGDWVDDEIDSYDTTLTFEKLVDYKNNNYVLKPYLRPMSSMTDEEKHEYTKYCFEQPFLQKEKTPNIGSVPMCLDWLNAHYFDYRGLIEKGLALEAPEGMYNF